jgi:hypothetical protein
MRTRERESQRAAAAAARELDAVDDLLVSQRAALDAVLRQIDARLSKSAEPTTPKQSRQSPASIQLDSEVTALLSRAADAGLLRGGHELRPPLLSPARAHEEIGERLSASIVRLRRLSVRESVASPS